MNKKKIYRSFLNVATKVLGVHTTKKLDARIRFHRIIDLKTPTTLADKLCWLELNREEPLKIKCSDKYAVREYVAEKGLEHILVPLCGGPYSHLEEINFEKLPNQFAMKAAHGCAMNLICEDKTKLNLEKAKKDAQEWLTHGYPRECIEPHYKKIPHRIICEQFLQDADKIIDYKFHCFHGEPDFVLVCGSRVSGLQKMLYDLNWNPIDGMIGHEKGTDSFEKPEHLEEMIRISKILSKDFDFVRVDLYDINGKVYFGELTFSPATGVLPNFSEEFIWEKGKKLNLNI